MEPELVEPPVVDGVTLPVEATPADAMPVSELVTGVIGSIGRTIGQELSDFRKILKKCRKECPEPEINAGYE